MGRLDLASAGALNMNKIAVSVWFRIPQSTVDAARVASSGQGAFAGIVPLVIFGTPADGDGTNRTKMTPSFIGAYFSQDKSILYTNIATDDSASWSDPSFSQGYPEYLGGGSSNIPVAIGTWNHLVMSWDLAGGSSSSTGFVSSVFFQSYSTSSKLWCALNDVNYDGLDLPAMTAVSIDPEGGHGPNEMLSYSPWALLHPGPQDGSGNNTETVSVSFSAISTSPISIPGPASVLEDTGSISPVKHVEMAELQIFTGVTLDTSVESNRRAFITADGKPADPALAATLLGKQPDIAFTSSSAAWIAGTNSGSLAGSFAKTGTVRAFTPDPQLGT